MFAINRCRKVRTIYIWILSALTLAGCGGGGESSDGSSSTSSSSTTTSSSSSSTTFSIGGTVSGLKGSLTLRNDGADDLVIGADGTFKFATRLASGANYDVQLASEPANQICGIANGVGTLTNVNVTNVAVTCMTLAADPVVSGIAPSHGPYDTLVTITGSGFSTTLTDNIVTLNNRQVEVRSATTTELQVLVPAHAGSGNFQVTEYYHTAQSSKYSTTASSSLFTYDLTSVSVTTIAGNKGYGYQDGPTADAKFRSITGLALNGNGGALFVADGGSHAIRTFNYVAVGTLAGGVTAGFKDGAGGEAQFETPEGLALDSSGNLYVADCGEPPCGNGNVRKITPAGAVETYWRGMDVGNDIFFGLTFGSGDTLYVADYGHHGILQIDSPSLGGAVTTLAGTGNPGDVDGAGSTAQFQFPEDVTYCPDDGNLYVADTYNMKIRKVTRNPGSTVVTYTGNTGGLSYVDGDLATARFEFPSSLKCDQNGTLFVADSGNNRIRMITRSGVVSTLAGGFPQGTADGDAATAQFSSLGPIIVGEEDGVLYVGDLYRIRRISWL